MIPVLPINPSDAILYALFVPVIAMFGIMLAQKSPNLREGVILIGATITFLMALTIFAAVGEGERPTRTLFEVLPGLSISFTVEPLGALFGIIASGLFIVNSCYSIGYMRGNKETHQTRFYMSFAVAIAAALGIAFAGNLFTFFTFYEVLTLSTFPLVTHKRDAKARAGGRIYLGILIGTSIGLLLPAMIWTYGVTGTTDFVPGGIMNRAAFMTMTPPLILLGLYLWGSARRH